MHGSHLFQTIERFDRALSTLLQLEDRCQWHPCLLVEDQLGRLTQVGSLPLQVLYSPCYQLPLCWKTIPILILHCDRLAWAWTAELFVALSALVTFSSTKVFLSCPVLRSVYFYSLLCLLLVQYIVKVSSFQRHFRRVSVGVSLKTSSNHKLQVVRNVETEALRRIKIFNCMLTNMTGRSFAKSRKNTAEKYRSFQNLKEFAFRGMHCLFHSGS